MIVPTRLPLFLTLLFVFVGQILIGQNQIPLTSASTIGGLGIGSVIAIVASWSRNKSIIWAIIHAFCGWFYVVYYILTR